MNALHDLELEIEQALQQLPLERLRKEAKEGTFKQQAQKILKERGLKNHEKPIELFG